MQRLFLTIPAAMALAFGLTACEHENVRNLAAQVSVNLTKVQGNIGRMVKSAENANKEAAQIVAQHEGAARSQEAMIAEMLADDLILYGTKKSAEKRARHEALRNAIDVEIERRLARIDDHKARIQELLGTLGKAPVDKKKYESVKAALDAMAKKEGAFESLGGLLEFLGDVGDEISKQQKVAEGDSQ